MCFDEVSNHSSQFQSLCSTKSSSEMLQNVPYFIYLYKNPKLLFPFFISCYFIFLPDECPVLCRFCKYGKFWSVSLELFVEHKLWNWEECADADTYANLKLATAAGGAWRGKNELNFGYLCMNMWFFFGCAVPSAPSLSWMLGAR